MPVINVPIENKDGEEIEYEIQANYCKPIAPKITADPYYSYPGEPEDYEILEIDREDGKKMAPGEEEMVEKWIDDHSDQFMDWVREAFNDSYEAAYENYWEEKLEEQRLNRKRKF